MKEKIVLIDGCRTPFLKSETDFLNTMTHELGQLAIKGLLNNNMYQGVYIHILIVKIYIERYFKIHFLNIYLFFILYAFINNMMPHKRLIGSLRI